MSKRPAVPSPRPPPLPETAAAAWQRLLTAQQKIVLRNEPLARRGSVKALHDLRVALRRIRTLCATFHDLSPTALTQLERSAAKVGDRMGNARDLDVWIELLKSLMRANGSADLSPREQRAIIRTLQEERTRQEAALALDCASFQRTKTLIDKLANQRRYRTTSASRDAFAARRMLQIRALIEKRYRQVGSFSEKPAHDLRRAGRRMRYLTEFFANGFGAPTAEAGKWIIRSQAALGGVHDCDNALKFTRDLPEGRARTDVRRTLQKRRREELKKFKTAWRRYAAKRLQKAWQIELKAAAGK